MADPKREIVLALLGQQGTPAPSPVETSSAMSLADLGNYFSPSNQSWAPWPVRAIRSSLAALAAPGDAYAGRLPMMDASGHTSLDAIGRATDLAGLMTLGAGAAPAHEGMTLGSGFVRRTRGNSPDNGIGHMMFVDEAKKESINSYGKNLWHFESSHVPQESLVDASSSEFRKGAYRALRSEHDRATARALVDEANPERIVNSAGLWDDPSSVELVWNKYLEPKNVMAVITNDGAVVFDPSFVRKLR